MARKNDKLPDHKWLILGTRDGQFIYKCKACKHETLNGEPLVLPYKKECIK